MRVYALLTVHLCTHMHHSPMTEPLPPFAKEWMAQWRYAAQELPKIRDRELRELTDQRAIAAAIALEPARPFPLRDGAGMVAMQQALKYLQVRTCTSLPLTVLYCRRR